ncbi:hypothetical protein [Tolypothrix sp. VBCCA 56010]|uniref:hypothetical protein n=1 Tax=Tolypothrix sp. VBCCA 56010 TaxID=3137731 RepID=UPI003D7D7CBE
MLHNSPQALLTYMYDSKEYAKVTGMPVCRFFHQQPDSDWHKAMCQCLKSVRTVAVPTFAAIPIVAAPSLIGMTI